MNKQRIYTLLLLVLALVFVFFFTKIIIYILLASIVSALGIPLKNLMQKPQIKGKSLPDAIASGFSILLISGVIITLVSFIVPIISSQSNEISKINFTFVSEQIKGPLYSLDEKLVEYSILNEGQHLDQIVIEKTEKIIKGIQIDQVMNQVISLAGSILIGVFSVLFISFFFIKEEKLFSEIVLIFTPVTERLRLRMVLLKIREMLSKYVLGLFIDLSLMMLIITLLTYLFGIKNALLIGAICAVFNIIPYIGPLLGAFVASILVFVSSINGGLEVTYTLILKMLGILAAANLIDSFVFQPFIYSNSVKAHPLEIFIVILMGGAAFGPIGMVLAVPTYTILRIAAKEFFGDSEFIQKLTHQL